MTRKELIDTIKSLADYEANGKVIVENRTYNGHPNFYLIHSKEEFDNELESIVPNKEEFDRYDLYYYSNFMFKYMLNQYDSHTAMNFTDGPRLPIKIRFCDSKPYIVGGMDSVRNIIGGEILKINGIDINIILNELEKIICYSSNEFLKLELENRLIKPNILNSLPMINVTDSINITTDKGEINFDLNNLESYHDSTLKPNYDLEVKDENIAVITYNACRDKDKMVELVEKLKAMNNIENYIVDLRGNGGGDSRINSYLVDFLKGKNVVVLSDERVFSSARMCLIDLKNIGAKVIGTDPGTPISCFGNCLMKKEYQDMHLRFFGSVTYWFYDEDLDCHGIYKENWDEAVKERPDLLEPVYFEVDEKVELTLEDYIDKKDSVLDIAIDSFHKTKKI